MAKAKIVAGTSGKHVPVDHLLPGDQVITADGTIVRITEAVPFEQDRVDKTRGVTLICEVVSGPLRGAQIKSVMLRGDQVPVHKIKPGKSFTTRFLEWLNKKPSQPAAPALPAPKKDPSNE